MGSIRKASSALFKAVKNGIGKMRYRIYGTQSENKDAKGTRSVALEKEVGETVMFPLVVETQPETCTATAESAMNSDLGEVYPLETIAPLRTPIFVEMGQNLSFCTTGIKKVGKDILFLYDIDDTLYHPSNKLQVNEKAFLAGKYASLQNDPNALSFEECMERVHLYSTCFYLYGKISLEAYWEMLSEFDYLQYLSPDPALREFLLSMDNIRRCCFTNGPRERAENILAKLGLLDCFEVVVCLAKYDTNFCSKPLPAAYEFVTEVLGIEVPGNVCFFDDAEENIVTSKEIGWNGYWITAKDNIIDLSIRAIHELRKAGILTTGAVQDDDPALGTSEVSAR